MLAVVAVGTDAPWLVTVFALQFVFGLVFGRRYCLPCLAYFELIQRRFGEGPLEHSRPPRSGERRRATVLAAATAADVVGWAGVGVALGILVAALALLAAVTASAPAASRTSSAVA